MTSDLREAHRAPPPAKTDGRCGSQAEMRDYGLLEGLRSRSEAWSARSFLIRLGCNSREEGWSLGFRCLFADFGDLGFR